MLDRGAGGEGLELRQLFVVEVEGAVFGPCQLILALAVESDAAGLHEQIGRQTRFERQINSILNFVFLGLAQIAAKEHTFHRAVGQAEPQKAERALVLGGCLVAGPEAVEVVVPGAAVACLCPLGDLEVPGGFGADAVVEFALGLDDILDLLLVVVLQS